jgi:hypothetical protein
VVEYIPIWARMGSVVLLRVLNTSWTWVIEVLGTATGAAKEAAPKETAARAMEAIREKNIVMKEGGLLRECVVGESLRWEN